MSADCEGEGEHNVFRKHKYFPPIINGKINTEEFLTAATGVVAIVDKLGTLFAPVKYDMNGNIEKLTRCIDLDRDKNATLHDLVSAEITEGTNVGTDALLWLTRALYFVETFLYKLLEKANENISDTIKNELVYAYELTIKKYHNWMTQKIFKIICQMCPTKSQLYKSLDVSDMKIFIEDTNVYLDHLKSNRIEIQNLYKNINLENCLV